MSKLYTQLNKQTKILIKEQKLIRVMYVINHELVCFTQQLYIFIWGKRTVVEKSMYSQKYIT